MKNGIPKRRLFWLFFAAVLIVGTAFTAHHFLRKPATFTIEEVLWVKKDGVFHAPGSSVSRSAIDFLSPDYIDFDVMTYSGPVLLLHDSLSDGETSFSRTPLVLMPYDP